jgi:hypothetical protein
MTYHALPAEATEKTQKVESAMVLPVVYAIVGLTTAGASLY